MSLERLRQRIDAIDEQIVELLEQRAQTATEIAERKREASLAMHDPEREQRVLDHVAQVRSRIDNTGQN